jgi:hypothetical protein
MVHLWMGDLMVDDSSPRRLGETDTEDSSAASFDSWIGEESRAKTKIDGDYSLNHRNNMQLRHTELLKARRLFIRASTLGAPTPTEVMARLPTEDEL